MDNPILTLRGAGRYVTATDVADLKLGVTDGDPFVFTEGPLQQTRRGSHKATCPCSTRSTSGTSGSP